MNRKYLVLQIVILVLIITTGCNANNKVDSEYTKFRESYIKATEFIEEADDYLVAVNKMDSDVVETELENMQKHIDLIQASDKDADIVENLKTYYDGVQFLLYAHDNYNNLTIEEKQKVYDEALYASTTRDEFINVE